MEGEVKGRRRGRGRMEGAHGKGGGGGAESSEGGGVWAEMEILHSLGMLIRGC